MPAKGMQVGGDSSIENVVVSLADDTITLNGLANTVSGYGGPGDRVVTMTYYWCNCCRYVEFVCIFLAVRLLRRPMALILF